MAKKKLDSLMKESKIRDREDPDSFTIAALPPGGKDADKASSKVETFSTLAASFWFGFTHQHLDASAGLQGKSEDGTDTADEANPSSNKRTGRSFIGSFSKRKVGVVAGRLLRRCLNDRVFSSTGHCLLTSRPLCRKRPPR